MFDSPLAASAYEVLGVATDAPDEELRRAYRLRLRATHPDTGGEAALFIQVQRAWELVGAPELRAAYDRGHGFAGEAESWQGWHAPAARGDTRPRTPRHGEAGSQRRRLFLARVREWSGAEIADPYDPAFVRTVPRALRRLLADALAEERTARTIADLGIGFTAWHDVAIQGVEAAGPRPWTPSADGGASEKLDHIVLGPRGLYGLTSADLGGVARFRGGEVIGPDPDAPAPVTALLGRIRTMSRAARVTFTGGILVLPDDDLYPAVSPLGTIRGTPVVVVRQSALRPLLREGFPGARAVGGTELFELRTRIRQTVRFA